MIRLRHLGVMCSAGLVFGCCGGWTQEAPAAGPIARPESQQALATPLFRTNANLVVVDVVVRQKGKAVEGLKESDFRVLEDGKEQKIAVFEEHKSTETVVAPRPQPDLPPNTYSNAPRYAITSAANVLLLDGLNTPYTDQVYVRRRMLDYLRNIPPGSRIAVFTLASRLRMIEGFTSDSSVIEKALKEGKSHAQTSAVMDPVFDEALGGVGGLAAAGGASAAAVQAMHQFASDTQNFEVGLRLQMTMDAINQLARYLSTIPGRKNLIWFSGSFPLRFLQGGSSPQMDPMADFSGQVKQMAELLALSRVAVYPVDARGLMGGPSQNASTATNNPNLLGSPQTTAGPFGNNGQGGTAGNEGMNSSSMSQQITASATAQTVPQQMQQADQRAVDEQDWDHINMEQIAAETGGRAYINRNALAQAVGEAIENGSTYYTVAYAPENKDYNGALRQIRVQVPGDRYDLAYRHAYYAVDPLKEEKQLHGRVSPLIAAMQHGSLPLSEVLFEAHVVPGTDPGLKNIALSSDPAGKMAAGLKQPVRYVTEFTIDPRTLTSSTMPDGRLHHEVELTQVAYDPEGVRVNYNDVGLAVNTVPAQGGVQVPIKVHQEIDLPAGENYLRIGVHDLMSGRIGTLEIPLRAQKQREGVPVQP